MMSDSSVPPFMIRDLDAWCLRQMAYYGEQVQRQSGHTGPGSAMERARYQDGPRALPELNIRTLAWRSLASAGEHMGMAHFVHQASRGGVVPRPQMTFARGALLSASRAVYLLRPDEEGLREVHAAQLANQEAADALKYVKTLEKSTQDGHSTTGQWTSPRTFTDLSTAAGNILRRPTAQPGAVSVSSTCLQP